MNRVVDLMKNDYGNFVIQKALKLSQNHNRKRLVKLIQKNVDKIGDNKLIFKWKNIVTSFATNVVSQNTSKPFGIISKRDTTSFYSNNLSVNAKNDNTYDSKRSKYRTTYINDSVYYKSLSTTNLPFTYFANTEQN